MATTLQQLGASEIDIKLAPLQFSQRLCLVKTSPNTDFDFTPGRAGPDQTVSVNKLWPALKFNSYTELFDQLPKTDIDRKIIGRIKAKFNVAAINLSSQAGISLAQAGFAYLLGKGNNSANFLVVLKKNDSGDLIEDGMIFNFFDYVIEMEGPSEYCSSPEFQHAFKIAMARMEMEDEMNEGCGEDVIPAPVITVNLAKKTFDSIAQADQRKQMNQVQPKHKKAEASRRTSLRDKKQDKEMNVPVETVDFFGKEANASDISSFGAEDADEEEEEEGEPIGRKGPKRIRATPVADKLMDWAGMWNSMREQGWNWLPGDGVIDWYYIHPNFAKRSKTEMLKKGKVGEDYFINEESVMRYAKQNLGFRGKVATPASNNNDLKDRALERRGRKRSAAAAATAEPAVETKKKKKNSKYGKKQADKNSKAGKKQADKNSKVGKKQAYRHVMSSYESDSDTSHFNEAGYRPSFPTSSEAEKDIGVKSAHYCVFDSIGRKRSAAAAAATKPVFNMETPKKKKKKNHSSIELKEALDHGEHQMTLREMQFTIQQHSKEINLLKEKLKNSMPVETVDLTNEVEQSAISNEDSSTTDKDHPSTRQPKTSALAFALEQTRQVVVEVKKEVNKRAAAAEADAEAARQEKNAVEATLRDVQEDLEIQQETTEQVAVTLDTWQSRFDRVCALAEAAGVDAALLRSIRDGK